jgi:hypothetical protein
MKDEAVKKIACRATSTAALEVKSHAFKSQKTYILGFCAIWNGLVISAVLY